MALTPEQKRTIAVATSMQQRIGELKAEQEQVLGWLDDLRQFSVDDLGEILQSLPSMGNSYYEEVAEYLHVRVKGRGL